MRVKDLNEGELYAIRNEPNTLVILWKENFLQIVQNSYAARWRAPEENGLKGRPALYCGATQVNSNSFKQGWWKAHRFLINGDFYFVPGEHIKNVLPFHEVTY